MSFDEFQQLSKYEQSVEIYLNAVFVGKKEDPPFVFILHRLHNFYILGKLPVDGDQRHYHHAAEARHTKGVVFVTIQNKTG